MKNFKYIIFIALMLFDAPILAMAPAQVTKPLKKAMRKRAAKLGKGEEITVFGSDEEPIIPSSFESFLTSSNQKREYPTAAAIEEIIKRYIPDMTNIKVEKSKERGIQTGMTYLAYDRTKRTPEGTMIPLFFLKISDTRKPWENFDSQSSSQDMAVKLYDLQAGPIGRFGMKALSNAEIPIIVLQEIFFVYKGTDNQNYVIEVAHLAKGQQVYQIIENESLALIKRCAEKVGKALGLFHLEFMNYHNSTSPNDWTTMTHGDFHPGNVFFDTKTSRVYFIDNSGMAEAKLFNDFARLKNNISSLLNTCENMEEEDPELANYIVYFIKGYLNAYPLDKKKEIAAYLKSMLVDPIEKRAEGMNPKKYEKCMKTFITELSNILGAINN